MPYNIFYVLYTKRFKPDTTFAYVTRVIRIMTALIYKTQKFCTAFTCGAQRFSLAISECTRNTPKIWWGTDVEDFSARKTHMRRQKLGSVTSA